MWWDYQNLDKPRTDKRGTRRNFRVWHDVFTIVRAVGVARVFFWDDRREKTGLVLLGPETNQHVRDLHNIIEKLVASKELRAAHSRELRFPLERYYADYGAFPEEAEILAALEARA
jgi:hypothetical protein